MFNRRNRTKTGRRASPNAGRPRAKLGGWRRLASPRADEGAAHDGDPLSGLTDTEAVNENVNDPERGRLPVALTLQIDHADKRT